MGSFKPFVERIAVLGLSEKSHHNGCGIGVADVTTQRFFEDMDFYVSYPNGLTSHDPASMSIPPVMPNDRCAIAMAIHTCVEYDRTLGHRVVWMKNTLCLNRFLISENLLEEAERILRSESWESPRRFPLTRKKRLRKEKSRKRIWFPRQGDRSGVGRGSCKKRRRKNELSEL